MSSARARSVLWRTPLSGTGDYADLRGQGRSIISVDFTTGHFIGTEEGRVR